MIGKVGIVGAGTMGAGIMINCVTSDIRVTLIDRNRVVLDKARAKLDRYLARQVQKERLLEGDLPDITTRLETATDMSALGTCDLVIEAVFENLELKRIIFSDLEANVPTGTILATNTSCLRLADIAEVLERPERFCGMHYFSPAEINPVVELIEGSRTTRQVLEAAEGFLRATRKVVIACKDQNGFALNRFFCPYTNEAVLVLDEGRATTGQIDEVAKETFGLALGPFAVMNIIGTGTNLDAVRNLSSLGAFYTPAKGLIDHGEHNTPWAIEETPAPLDPATKKAISERLVCSVLLPVTEEISEGTATIEAVDKGAELAFRFQRTPGRIIEDLGQDAASERVRAFAAARRHSLRG